MMAVVLIALAGFVFSAERASSAFPDFLTPLGIQARGGRAAGQPLLMVLDAALAVSGIEPSLQQAQAMAESAGGREAPALPAPRPEEKAVAYAFPPALPKAQRERLDVLLQGMGRLGVIHAHTYRLEPSSETRRARVAAYLQELREEQTSLKDAGIKTPRTASLLHAEIERLRAWQPEQELCEGRLVLRFRQEHSPRRVPLDRGLPEAPQ